MEQSISEENQSTSSRFRSPVFSTKETNMLLKLIEKYKLIIMNKSTTSAANDAKDQAWTKIAKEFNKQDFGYIRKVDSLRLKWENMKREARKISKNVLGSKFEECDALNAKIVALLSDVEYMKDINNPTDSMNDDIEIDTRDPKQLREADSYEKFFEDDKTSDNDSEDGEEECSTRTKRRRDQNFSPQECRILLQCVRKEKKHIFNKDSSNESVLQKNAAWARVRSYWQFLIDTEKRQRLEEITQSFNKLSPQKRSTRKLRDKLHNMKTCARLASQKYFKNVGSKKKHKMLLDDSFNNVKEEPIKEYELDSESDHNEQYNAVMNAQECNRYSPANRIDFPCDPLSSVLNGDSGMGSTNTGTIVESENKEIIKLKIDLLNYQLETAKLERQRLERAMEEETKERQSKSIERALRLRTARLEAISAEMRLPPSHPALNFTPEETRAQQYLMQCQLEMN